MRARCHRDTVIKHRFSHTQSSRFQSLFTHRFQKEIRRQFHLLLFVPFAHEEKHI